MLYAVNIYLALEVSSVSAKILVYQLKVINIFLELT